MRNPLRPEAALAFFTLLVCLPVVAALIYIFGGYAAGLLADPLKYPGVLIFMTGYAIGLALSGLRALRQKRRARGIN